MKNKLVLLFLFFTILSYSQEKRKGINGKILFDKTVLSDVHILNRNTNKGTITNDKGTFEIAVMIGDSLQFTHVNLKSKQLIITKEIFTKRNLEIELNEITYALDGFTLEKPRSIFYVDPQMVRPTIVNAKTLNLPYANTTVKKEYSIVKFRSGAAVSVDNLINSLNGNNKRRKELNKISQEDNALSNIRTYFTDDFFITDLQIKKKHINPFLNYCVKKNIIAYFKRNENILLTKVLMNQSRTFPQKINSDSIIVSKE
jgi:hypothetical protein